MSNEMTSQNQITEGGILRPLLAFFFPILLGTFFQQLYNTADAVVVGNYVGTVALAAVGGSTGTLIGLFVNLFVGVASGFHRHHRPVLRRPGLRWRPQDCPHLGLPSPLPAASSPW